MCVTQEDCNEEKLTLISQLLKETMSTEDLVDMVSYFKEEGPFRGDGEGFSKSFLESL